MQSPERILPTVLEAVGNTPLVRLGRVVEQQSAEVLLKLEALNPGGSSKDRIAVALIEAAEREGRLSRGGTIVEATAGNTGIALAMAAAVRGYRAVFFVPDKMSRDKIRILQAYGADVRIVPDVPREDPENYQRQARRYAEMTPGAAYMGQFEHAANPRAHYETTGPEIWRDAGGRLDAFVAGAGTGGTITGIGRYLKEQDPSILVVGADPEGSIFSGACYAPFRIEGMGEDYYPVTLDPTVVDRWVAVSDDAAFAMARRIGREEGILVGGSTGAMVVVACALARDLGPGKRVVALGADTGRNYLSGFFSE